MITKIFKKTEISSTYILVDLDNFIFNGVYWTILCSQTFHVNCQPQHRPKKDEPLRPLKIYRDTIGYYITRYPWGKYYLPIKQILQEKNIKI